MDERAGDGDAPPLTTGEACALRATSVYAIREASNEVAGAGDAQSLDGLFLADAGVAEGMLARMLSWSRISSCGT